MMHYIIRIIFVSMIASASQRAYHSLDRPALLQLLDDRDQTIAGYRQDLLEAADTIRELRRVLGLRNKKIYGSSSEKSNREPVKAASYIDYEALDKEGRPTLADKQVTSDQLPIAKRTYRNSHPGRYAIPDNIRREEKHIYPEGYDPCWGRELPPERSERLSLRVELVAEVTIRHKFARGDQFVIAPYPPDDPFFKYKATTELVAHMLMMRFVLHVPYYRFQQLLCGCPLGYPTLIGWAKRAFDLLAPLRPLLTQEIVQEAPLLGMDETTFKLLDTPDNITTFRNKLNEQEQKLGLKPSSKQAANEKEEDSMEQNHQSGTAKRKVVLRGQMWTLINPATKLVLFEYSPTRATVNAMLLLGDWRGLLLSDCFSVYQKLAKLYGMDIRLLACWAHVRRKFLEAQDPKHPDPVVTEVITRIAALYLIEKNLKGLSPRIKKKIRKRSSTQLRSLKKYLEHSLQQYAPKEAVAQAIQYCLNHWEALSAYTRHGIAPMDNNLTERAIRPITVNRKNVLFLGSVEHAPGASLMYSLMQCCQLQGIAPLAYLLDVLKKIETYPRDQLADLLPNRWKKKQQNTKPPS